MWGLGAVKVSLGNGLNEQKEANCITQLALFLFIYADICLT